MSVKTLQRKNSQKRSKERRNRFSASELVRQGRVFLQAGDLERAGNTFERATRIDPQCAAAWAELAKVFSQKGQAAEAAECLERILEVSTPPAATRLSLGEAYIHLGELDKARTQLSLALAADASLEAKVRSLLGSVYYREKNWESGLAEAERALELDPDNLNAHYVRSRCFFALARVTESMESTRRVIAMGPRMNLHSKMLFEMNYLADTTPEILYQEACRWNELYAAPLANQIRPHTNTPDPGRQLKLGYVSPDLYNHAIMKLLPPVLENHGRSQFEIFLYSVGRKSDEMTEQLREKMENFVAMPSPSAEDLAERIRKDKIDILVDLAGHTMGPAYLAFALKPAPVQVSWMGVLSTTGMSTMDYFLGDPGMPCPGTEHLFSETIYRLPRLAYVYRPFTDAPVAEPPCLQRGHVMFGCYNNPRKITRDVVKLWSLILHVVPESRLLLKYREMKIPSVQQRLRNWFEGYAIHPERILFEGASPLLEYMFSWNNIDIALDPFPYTGGTTTLDALFMGVPTVTLAGRLAVQRQGAANLKAAGLPVAETPEQYVSIAVFLANNIAKLSGIRGRVRDAFRSSPAMDEAGFVRSLEAAFRDMWRNWCARSR